MSTSGIGPEALKRLRNLSEFWGPKMQAATSDADLARICFDRAKAAAKRAQRNGQAGAMHALAGQLAQWASDMERADATRHHG
ncbi:hypothetical protein ACFC8F_23120 [Streptomyces hydrogenans]|uniref:hypothetical protein n=1 Tax=Streptomyces hydrogenans TaxID=1873719 RepID=UPI0035D9C877